ncbi:MAG: 4Fe-4S binding protein, partial [Flavobacteriaceae bacterium]|nr:4Fe-4S binding protein [Flavobacteriaceae bacterium]
MAKVKGAIVVDTEKCKGCEVCMPVCLDNVISMSKEVNRKGFH